MKESTLWSCLTGKYKIELLFRFVKESTLWSCLAGMAVAAKQLETAETAYANIEVSKKTMLWIQKIFHVSGSWIRFRKNGSGSGSLGASMKEGKSDQMKMIINGGLSIKQIERRFEL